MARNVLAKVPQKLKKTVADDLRSIRTTNTIERLNKEFKRRTKPMEIVAGENSCYLLLAFISLKMEMSWRRTKIGKVCPNLPLYKKFTQLC